MNLSFGVWCNPRVLSGLDVVFNNLLNLISKLKKNNNINVYWFSWKTLESPPFELYEDIKGVLLFSFRFHLALIIVCCFSPLSRIIWTFFFSLKGNNLTLTKQIIIIWLFFFKDCQCLLVNIYLMAALRIKFVQIVLQD